jgi:23S rRNA (cytosine1962-C5)-methyltransferase
VSGHALASDRGLASPAKVSTVAVRSPGFHPLIFRKMLIEPVPHGLEEGDLVRVVDRDGIFLGHGLWSARSQVAIRLFGDSRSVPDPLWWKARLSSAVALRTDWLRLDQVSTAYRVVHAEGDGLPSLVVDRYGETLSAEAFTAGMYQRGQEILSILEALLGTKHWRLHFDARAAESEQFQPAPGCTSPNAPAQVEIREHGIRFRIHFETGHKTGFFCDQRENRRLLAQLSTGRHLLDLCSYTGGFALAGMVQGAAASATAVDLDEDALALGRQNANLNQVRISWVQADAFAYARQMLINGRTFDLVILDPPKLIPSRAEFDLGMKKYYDLNRLAAGLVTPGGVLLTCSCSGLLAPEPFVDLLRSACRSIRRPATLLNLTGAGSDHPVGLETPEGRYLKAAWLRFDSPLSTETTIE